MITGIVAGLATSWIMAISSFCIFMKIRCNKFKADINAAHKLLRLHLKREHDLVATDYGKCVRQSGMAHTEASYHTEDVQSDF